MKPTIIIGAGISGLSAGLHLHRKGFTVKIIEASEWVAELKPMWLMGLDWIRVSRSYSYPEAKQLLDYDALQLKTFLPGATVLYDGGQFEIADPFRRPSVLLVGLHLLAH
jgi:flavin-dependent dehydrogenase